jgi:hypothetical protein
MSLFIGKYVPALSYTIHTKNPGAKQVINFKGKNKIINLNKLQIKTEGLYTFYCLVECNIISLSDLRVIKFGRNMQFTSDTIVYRKIDFIWRIDAFNGYSK